MGHDPDTYRLPSKPAHPDTPGSLPEVRVRDPGYDLVEIESPDVGTLDRGIVPETKKPSDTAEQSGRLSGSRPVGAAAARGGPPAAVDLRGR
jgi:hypothetical protein